MNRINPLKAENMEAMPIIFIEEFPAVLVEVKTPSIKVL